MAQRRPIYSSSSPLESSASSPPARQPAQAADDDTLLRTANADHVRGPTGPVTSQKQLNDYREKLARDLEIRELSARGLLMNPPDKARVSPIPEEALSGSPVLTAALTTASTESNNTSIPPQPPPAGIRMPYPTGFEFRGILDKVLSENSTPASNYTFNPSAATPHQDAGFDFPNPNLYDLSLMLSAEPGLDAWWSTVVHIMKDVYKAERVTLAVPADSTDLENVPWGQKATYSEHDGNELSMGYMARSSSVMQSSERGASDVAFNTDDVAELGTPARPGLPSRHSFTSYEDNKQKSLDRAPSAARRPTHLMRSKSHFQSARRSGEASHGYTELNKDALDEHDAVEGQQAIPSWEAPFMARFDGQGRVLPVLQALDYEADPLIDHAGVMRVLQRGRPVALTRSYPYLAANANQSTDQPIEQKPGSKTPSSDFAKRPKRPRAESTSKLSSIFPGTTRSKSNASDKAKSIVSRLDDDEPRPPTPKYEEYEQAPPSPWSQSPAPSPAVRAEPKENPFFTDAMVDEGSFNPDSGPTSYSGMPPPEAIGVDNSWTVLHIPLTHDEAGENRKESIEAERLTPELPGKNETAPIAILSILSPIIPYPSKLRRSLEHLAPHMATSFSLCRHYSNLETELAGIQRRRPPTAGFGAVTPYPRHGDNGPFTVPAGIAQQAFLGGSMTSPSDYSAVSKSTTGSPLGTPSWEQGSLNYLVDKRQPAASPAAMSQSGEGYFSTDKKSSLLSAPRAGQDASGLEAVVDRIVFDIDEANMQPRQEAASKDAQEAGADTSDEAATAKTTERQSEPLKFDASRSHHGHSVLHSYGADFASTFQSLPPSSTLSRPPPTSSALPRSTSLTTLGADMPPPSDRLKGLILDSLPAHVFVSLPQTGETVWVNSRFLSYRGQTVADLAADPWGSIHSDDRDGYLKAWGHSLRTGEQFSRTVRIKRFDGAYRWFYARAVASKDKRGVIMQFLGSYMDIHDQHIAELRAARQEEVEASEAKHRLLANLIPQIIFTATEDEGITFANEQWLSYTGQSFEDSLNLGFMDHVHPDDLARCRIPIDHRRTSKQKSESGSNKVEGSDSSEATSTSGTVQGQKSPMTHESKSQSDRLQLSRSSSSGTESTRDLPCADLTELARKGIFKVTTDTSGRLSYTTEVRLRSKTGEYRWHLIRCVEIDTIDFGRGASSYFGSATDINDHKILETKLKEAMESKSRFLSNMSHEIRTPLIGISGMVSFLQDTTLDEEQRDYTNTIQTSANSLIMIINDILDLSKVDAGMMKLKYEWFHTRSLIEDVNELVSTMAIAKRLELNYLVDADVPAWVKGDKVRIRQVLLNVIGNAIKFTTEGEVFSRCRVYADSDSKRDETEIRLQFAITDTGRGFSKEEADLIFKPFSQIDGSSTRQHGGSGLGLVISRQLVELHGGKMEGTAELGKGSTFTFTACFGLPTPEDHPTLVVSPASTISAGSRRDSADCVPRTGKPLPAPLSHTRHVNGVKHPDSVHTSPSVASAGSSIPSMHSGRSHNTDRSSATSVNAGLARFSEAAKASGQDLSQMKLEMPAERGSPRRTAVSDNEGRLNPDFRPPMYSILIICPQYHSREATTQHIEMTLPKDVPHQITALAAVEEAQQYIGGEDPIKFTHIVLNLASAEAIIHVMDQITKSQKMDRTTIVILSDSVQRQVVMKQATDTKYERLLTDNLVTFIYKPVKPSRFAVIFDPEKVRDLSTDRNRSTAQQMVENQKASYQEIERRMGNKGYKVLLVEDNPVNQKVLVKYLKKIGVDVDIAVDGVECIDQVLSKPHKHYSLILCDLHMPRKDGYQACREIRQWEAARSFPKMPIIALSANVMSDVQDKCIDAGFSDYVTKPVDFIDLSRAMAKFF
ncbi:histidine kinase-, DNA gyrase b-, and HSP90-like ATPase domain-containing protein [Hirsutella rhossiliensis]|uniref:histidine kinase n=1 Tax=Hirsutella rhossiliensis TaxID=111463 RepID=A0A9P8SGV0_9HYPO|nr:histidine kinase-, DNA gyrase b-, and HSP90-like ATPase domain-containing protein [Hirsutella rhossiliensis]KAH0960875.1 histidine kinase-, DNA gyrase b-, and HSP90-like ATPase domain-containing protein [Hirsutella rhossiliensis]